MRRLIEKGLMFGNLIRVDSPAWVARYNRALEKLIGKQTALDDFYIDISGFSPEVGDELGDLDYLAPEGGERQFILLTTEQKTAPMLNADLSVLREALVEYIQSHEPQLFTLTARDAVIGQLDDQVWQLKNPADLLQITGIRITADTTGNHVAETGRLTALIEQLRNRPDGWADDVLIAQMISQATKTGDVLRNPVTLTPETVAVPDFRSAAFGGVYVIRSAREPAMILSPEAAEAMPEAGETLGGGIKTLRIDAPHEIAAWLARNALAEPIVTEKGPRTAAILRQKIDFILIDAATRLGLDTGDGSRADLRRAAARMGADLPAEIEGLAGLQRYAEQGGGWPVIDSRNPAYFYALRASAGPARDVINALISELAPHDVRALFITNKPMFYRLYQSWPDAKRAYVVDHLVREYQMDKQGTRDALFGPEPDMSGPDPVTSGPWGPVATSARAKPVRSPWGDLR